MIIRNPRKTAASSYSLHFFARSPQVIALLAPYAFKRWGDVKEELKKIKCSLPKFFFAVIFNSILQMSINSFWTASVQTIPTQLTVAIFQCSVGVVYIISLLFLGEEFQFKKALGVVLALVGVNLASFFPPVAMASASSHTVSFMQNINYPKGIALATAALAAKVGTQIISRSARGIMSLVSAFSVISVGM